MIQFVFEGSVKSMFESVVQSCTKYLKAMTSRQAPAKMFMYATITHCQGKITQRALALWHLHSWHLDVPPKARNSRREIQEPKGPVLSCKSTCQSTRDTIGNTSALKKLAERIYIATKKGVLVLVLYHIQIVQKLTPAKMEHMSRFCESTDFRKPTHIDCKCVWSPHKPTKNLKMKWYSLCLKGLWRVCLNQLYEDVQSI